MQSERPLTMIDARSAQWPQLSGLEREVMTPPSMASKSMKE
jgi:hypothetical protein